ncbi:sulfurtransferase TusA family protein [Marinimicrobium alkaliphilum]|uniref:sulfurtransferase TusA family protein n=1 Tax=Marinimicrobium alkaliphilum TaxID=2202654 RepID=UPI000DB97B19|nr:sulfurtransferase TusA family protein [Marinimicrobium alkaliphilum]
MDQTEPAIDVELDAKGMRCPLPLLRAKQALNAMDAGQCLRVEATDAGSVRDFHAFAELSGHQLVQHSSVEGVYTYLLIKRT